ncbi:MAG: hypothetical protein HQL69_22505 [Magnetococcales bacterium]|nr:hypothetical protein [Magnetococcales bacterium]
MIKIFLILFCLLVPADTIASTPKAKSGENASLPSDATPYKLSVKANQVTLTALPTDNCAHGPWLCLIKEFQWLIAGSFALLSGMAILCNGRRDRRFKRNEEIQKRERETKALLLAICTESKVLNRNCQMSSHRVKLYLAPENLGKITSLKLLIVLPPAIFRDSWDLWPDIPREIIDEMAFIYASLAQINHLIDNLSEPIVWKQEQYQELLKQFGDDYSLIAKSAENLQKLSNYGATTA